MPQKEQKEPCITLPNALEMPAKNKQESFISDQNYDLLGATDCLGELRLNPEKHQPALEEQGMLFVCCEDTGTGCRENRKLRPTESPSSAKRQLWGQKDNLERTEEDQLGQEHCRPTLSSGSVWRTGENTAWKAAWVRVNEPKGLGSLQRGTRKVKMLISDRQITIRPELCYECLGRLNYRNKKQKQIC